MTEPKKQPSPRAGARPKDEGWVPVDKEPINKIIPIPTPPAIKAAAEQFRRSHESAAFNENLRCMVEAQFWFEDRYADELAKHAVALKLQGKSRAEIKEMLAQTLMSDLNSFGIKLDIAGHRQRAENLLSRLELENYHHPSAPLRFDDVTPDSVRQSYLALARDYPGQVRECR